MRAVIRVIDTAAVITGAVTQDNRKEERRYVPLYGQKHTCTKRSGLMMEAKLSVLKLYVRIHSPVSQIVGRR